MYFKKEIGIFGEDAVIEYLKEHGYNIVERNYTTKSGEIDIIANENREIVFIEVKTRRSLKYGMPSEAVNSVKMKHIVRAAKYYLYITNQENFNIRFDVIEVFLEKNRYRINHIKKIDISANICN